MNPRSFSLVLAALAAAALPSRMAVAAPPKAPLPTLFVCGDSTSADNGNPAAVGWGVPLAAYFDPSRIEIANRSRGGRSSRTYLTEGLWGKVLSEMKPGDVVLLQFGHNDAGAINDASRARGSLPGSGEETESIDNLLTHRHEIVHTYGWYLRRMIADARAKGALPVVVGLTVRDIWHWDIVERGPGTYSALAEQVAAAEHAPYLDLTGLIADAYERLGPAKVHAFFPRDHTHTNLAGATLNAELVVAGLERLFAGMPPGRTTPIPSCFPGYLSAAGRALAKPPPHVRRPLPTPANPALPSLFLIGDSTVRNGEGNGAGGQWGWGDPIRDDFDAAKLNVVNRAVGGLSSRTYLTGGNWAKTLELIKPGDVVIMQFGRNDGGRINDAFRARASLKGVGEETESIDNLLTHRREIVHTYGWYLRKYIADARAKGATAIVCSPTPQKIWRDGEVVYEDYARWARQAAGQGGAAFVDLEAIICSRYVEMGPRETDRMYADPHTHNSWEGAVLNAECVVAGLKALAEDPLGPYFSAAGRAIPPWSTTFRKPSQAPGFWALTPRPVMGWNSWDCFATTITEAQVKAQAAAMVGKLRSHGWEYLTVDIQWYEPGAESFEYRKGAPLTMDGWGRLAPAPNRFPSAAGGAGFRPLADWIHARGLKFGLHLLRGIPRQAVDRNLPVKGTAWRAADIADREDLCAWNADMVGVDMRKPGAQAYYDSVFALLAGWGVDLVKVDDVSRPYHAAEIEAIRTAIDRSGRPMVLSLSPGATPLSEGAHAALHANQWRISDDFWDSWQLLYDQFARLDRWTPFRGPGHFPDADMLPLGTIALGQRQTHFTAQEQRTLVTLWAVARSPLIVGADLTKLDPATLALLTNDEVIAVDQASAGNRQLFRRGDRVAWIADAPGGSGAYLALFNTSSEAQPVTAALDGVGFAAGANVRDLWEHEDLGEFRGEFTRIMAPHGAGLYRLRQGDP